MNKRQLSIGIILLATACMASWAQNDKNYDYKIKEVKEVPEETKIVRGSKLKAYSILPETCMPIRVEMPDTLTTLYYNRFSAEGRSLAIGYTGNINSPWHDKIFFNRPIESSPFAYFSGFDGMIYTPRNAKFYNTRTPFTLLNFQNNMSYNEKEERLSGTFGVNFGRKVNIGADFETATANGFYNSNKVKDRRYRFFGSYTGDKYELYAYIANDYYNINENGGIANDDYIYHPENFNKGKRDIKSKDIPVNIPNEILFNRLRSGHAFLSHRYNFGYKKDVDVEQALAMQIKEEEKEGINHDEEGHVHEHYKIDSVKYIPVASISHTLEYDKYDRRFISKQPFDWSKIYANTYIVNGGNNTGGNTPNIVNPNDTMAMNTLKNTIAVSLREGFRSWVKFGLSGYVRFENRRYSIINLNLNDNYKNAHSEFATYVGAQIDRLSGKGLNFIAKGEFAVLGEDIGAFRMDGILKSRFNLFRKDFGLTANAEFYNTNPSYFTKHQHGTFHWWDENFKFIRRLSFGGRADLESYGLWAKVQSATLQNYISYGRDGKPQQNSNVIQILSTEFGQKYHWSNLNWIITANTQVTSDANALPLPAFAMYGNLFFDFYLAKVLRIQTGLEGYYHSAYKAPFYEPSIQQFVNQDEKNIGGNNALINAYANFHLKRARFFIKMYNIADGLIKSDRFSLLHYPINPRSLNLGIIVDFNN
ncbi:putative porin [Porphyromonas pogonae]|uniref:putative porin n=1 Tax=Porphyromonas pogonae TaxID=867595 RepID=UPI002E7A2324|nr:putative porin [Porphyromonas pogonae]